MADVDQRSTRIFRTCVTVTRAVAIAPDGHPPHAPLSIADAHLRFRWSPRGWKRVTRLDVATS